MAKVKSLEQIRAKHAWKFIENVKEKKGDYLTAMRKLPAMILTSGLGQTVAFYLSKKNEHQNIINRVAEHLSKVMGIEGITCGTDLLKKIMQSNHEEYIILSREALKYATWLKRLAEAELEGE